jgi:hypothetical protein
MKSSSTLFNAAVIALVLAVGCSSSSDSTGLTTSQGTGISSAKAITAFSFTNPSATGTVSETTHAIAVTVPAGTDITALIATFTTSGASVTVGTTVQVSGVTPNNFASPVVYTVSAADGTTIDYTVTVNVTAMPPVAAGKAFLTFELAGVSGAINEGTRTISVVLPPDGTDVTTLIATFTVSPGATARVGSTAQTSGLTQNDYTHPVVYTVVASDTTSVTYTVSVAILTAPKLMSEFSFKAIPANGVIDQNAKTISATIPLAASISSLVASYITTPGAIVKVGSIVQTNGVTPNDFTNAVVYTVVAPDGLSVDYTVAVSIIPPTFESFFFSSVSVTAVIDQTVHAIAATVPASTNVSTLVSTFTTTNASLVSVGVTAQTSAVTPNDFTSAVIYTLTGDSSQNYTVTVTKAPGVLSLPRTGQISSYSTNTTPDDGTIQRGVIWPIPRFSAAGSVVMDNLTGLQWPQHADTPTAVGCTGGVMSWQNALAYVACLNANNYLTYNDWRMSNANELMSLLTAGVPNVYSWLNSGGFINMQGNFYFTSTTDPVITTQARIVNMVTGNSVFGAKTDLLNVLPVRGTSNGRAPLPQTGQTASYDAVNNADDGALRLGLAWPGTRFTDPAAGTLEAGYLVVDQLTGLMWPADGNIPGSPTCSMNGTWQGALDYVACLNTSSYRSYRDWRLPNINELESLINAGQPDSSSWLNSQGFHNVQGNAYWSSTTDANTTSNAWLLFMAGGDKESTAKTSTGTGGIKAWPVRSGY